MIFFFLRRVVAVFFLMNQDEESEPVVAQSTAPGPKSTDPAAKSTADDGVRKSTADDGQNTSSRRGVKILSQTDSICRFINTPKSFFVAGF